MRFVTKDLRLIQFIFQRHSPFLTGFIRSLTNSMTRLAVFIHRDDSQNTRLLVMDFFRETSRESSAPVMGRLPGRPRCLMASFVIHVANYELQINWEHPTPAAAMLILRPARQAKKVCGGDSVARHPTAVALSLSACPTTFPGYRPERFLLQGGDAALTPGITI